MTLDEVYKIIPNPKSDIKKIEILNIYSYKNISHKIVDTVLKLRIYYKNNSILYHFRIDEIEEFKILGHQIITKQDIRLEKLENI